jgi:hypothetical protein
VTLFRLIWTRTSRTSLGVDGAAEVDHAAVDLDKNFVEMPGRIRLWPSFVQVGCGLRPEIIHPAPHGLIGDRDPGSANKSSMSRKLRMNRTCQIAYWMISGKQ